MSLSWISLTDDYTSFTKRLRAELLRAAQSQNDRTKRRQKFTKLAGPVLVALAILAVGVAGVSFATQRQAAAAVLSIHQTDDGYLVNLKDSKATPSQVTADLKRQGIKSVVNAVPAAPSQVGKFVDVTIEGNENLQPINLENTAFVSFSVKNTQSSTVYLSLGRLARPNEPFARSLDPFATGGALHCSNVWGTTVTQARSTIGRSFAQVSYLPSDAEQAGVTSPDVLAGDFVVGGLQNSNESVRVVVSVAPNAVMVAQRPNTSDCPK